MQVRKQFPNQLVMNVQRVICYVVFLFCMVALTAPQAAAGTSTTPAAMRNNYMRAAFFLRRHVQPLVDHAVHRANWLDDTHFWYVDHDADGDHYEIMDATTGKAASAFDQKALARALSKATGTTVSAAHLDLAAFHVATNGVVDVTVRGASYRSPGARYTCDLAASGRCVKQRLTVKHEPGTEPGTVSPNGKFAVFVRDWNLWLRNVQTGAERPLTTNGVENDGYATQNAGWQHGDGAIVRWSPDSTKVATYRQDQRKVGNMYALRTQVGHPQLTIWKEALPGDKEVLMIEPVVIDIQSGKLVRLKMKPEERLSTLCDSLACDRGMPTTWSDVKWAPNSKTLAFVTTSRNRQHEWFRIANAEMGNVHTGFHYRAKDFYESGHGRVNWQYLPRTNQAIWPTTQNNWLNLYLYNLKTGKQIRPVTTGEGNVDEVLRVNRKTGTLWFVGNARTPGINPYFKQFFKVDIATGRTTLLTPEPADHNITMSPDGKYFVDSYSTVTQPPITVLRSSKDGHVIATVAKADISRLKAADWVPPKVIKVKARDGKTTLYGLMFRPSDFDPHKKYPIIDYIYPGPQTGSVFTFGFAAARSDHQAMAELGFVVVAIDGMGTPWRSASFHKLWYGNAADNTLPDQITAIKQLARRDPWIDIHRVGIWGHSGGGNATAAAMFLYPDFFKVGWAESGNYDFRNYENKWGEKYQGLLVKHPNGTTNYDSQALQRFAKNLKGHLMLVHGSVDPNVPTGETLLVVNSLIKANKDFDMLILPDMGHGYGRDSAYVMRRRWDYFVRYLQGTTPPHNFPLRDLH